MVEHATRRAAQEFFRRSSVWKEDVSIALVADQPLYPIVTSTGTVPVLVVSASIADRDVDPTRRDEDMIGMFGPAWREVKGAPVDLLQTSPDSVRMFPMPAASGESLIASVSVTPSDDATGIPDALAIRYRDAIAAGALARMMLSAKKPWSDDARGTMYLNKFEAGIGKAQSDRATGFGRGRAGSRLTWC